MPSWSAPLAGPGLVVDLAQPIDLSLRVRFDRPASRAFSLPAPQVRAVEGGAFVGDVRRGGSCNCETYTITPHGDGTHTEGIGHLLDERVPVIDLLTAPLLPAVLISVEPKRLEEVADDVAGNHAPDDLVIDELSLIAALDDLDELPNGFTPIALVVRTSASKSDDDREARTWSGANPPYFTIDAMEAVVGRGFDHVLVDLPSLDREDDGGLLAAHRAFFELAPRQTHLEGPPLRRTVTELCSIPGHVAPGPYGLALQLAPIVADAVPSRPLLFPLVVAAPSWLRSP